MIRSYFYTAGYRVQAVTAKKRTLLVFFPGLIQATTCSQYFSCEWQLKLLRQLVTESVIHVTLQHVHAHACSYLRVRIRNYRLADLVLCL